MKIYGTLHTYGPFGPFPKDGNLGWWLSISYDGDDEPGDPSGLFAMVCGWQVGLFWETHRKIEILWSLGSKPKVLRW